MLKRKIDDVASRAELVQYERRFVVLYEQIASNLEETRRYYTKYNTLTDTPKFLTKEISILNSISSKYSAVSASETHKGAFLSQIDTIQVRPYLCINTLAHAHAISLACTDTHTHTHTPKLNSIARGI